MNKRFKYYGAALATLPAVWAGNAMAELPTGVSTGITGAQTDGLAAVGLLAVFGTAVFLIVKVLKRLGLMA